MPWISLSAYRYVLRTIVEGNLDYAEDEESRLEEIDAMYGRSAMLYGDEAHVARECRLARLVLEEFQDEVQTPDPEVLGDVLSLAVMAELDGADCGELFRSIGEAKLYKGRNAKSLQLLARRMAELEKTPTKPYGERGHVKTEAAWLRVVKDVSPADAFGLSVTPDHPEESLLEKFILPLGYLAARAETKGDWRARLRRMLRRGDARAERTDAVVYERTDEPPSVEVRPDPEDRTTWRGFDAVELADDEVVAYYYLGVGWEAPLFFEEMINVYQFLDGVDLDWRLVEETLAPELRRKVKAAREAEKCSYVVVYDANSAHAPEPALARARAHYGLEIIPRDLTEV
ncbi:MAG TPA: hypothetical protein VGW12_13985 [Pyrinomonadaceae bacterium]|nr:hypothetical protein [Pyrinomonadaceae bacterium]